MDCPEAQSRRLVAVVVTYNRLAQLKTTLARLLETPSENLSAIVVVDNASGDGTGAWLRALNDLRLDIICCESNLGGAGGFRLGMQRAMAHHDPDWLVLMDDDGRPEPGTFAHFHAIPDARWDAIAAAVYLPSGEICEMNRPSRNPFWHGREFLRTVLGGGRSGFHLKSSDYEGSGQKIDVTSFVGFFVSRRAVDLAGYPDGRYFLYADDGIYTLGLSAKGARIGFEPALRFEHDLSTFGASGAQLRPIWKVYYYHRNLLVLYRQAAGWLFWPACLIILPRWIVKGFGVSQRRLYLRLLWRGICDGLWRRFDRSHPEILSLSGFSPQE